MDEQQRRILNANAMQMGVSPEDYAMEALLYRMEEDQDRRVAEAAYFKWLKNPDDTVEHEALAKEVGLR